MAMVVDERKDTDFVHVLGVEVGTRNHSCKVMQMESVDLETTKLPEEFPKPEVDQFLFQLVSCTSELRTLNQLGWRVALALLELSFVRRCRWYIY